MMVKQDIKIEIKTEQVAVYKRKEDFMILTTHTSIMDVETKESLGRSEHHLATKADTRAPPASPPPKPMPKRVMD
jgi:hypothetical protein